MMKSAENRSRFLLAYGLLPALAFWTILAVGVLWKSLHGIDVPWLFCMILASALVFYLTYQIMIFTDRRVGSRWQERLMQWSLRRILLTGIILSGLMVLMVMWATNYEFGAWDFGVINETMWRQWLGQHAYTDFLTANPPGFNLGLKLAVLAFGPSWNTQAYAICIFGVLTFWWLFWLLRQMDVPWPQAFLVSAACETSTVVVLSFWWYNNVTSLSAAVFFLSALALLRRPDSTPIRISYMASLAMLGLMKPNVAGLLGVGAFAILLLLLRKRGVLVGLTTMAIAMSVAVLWANGISIPEMLHSYEGVAKSRGLHAFGFDPRSIPLADAIGTIFWLCMPLAVVIPSFIESVKTRDRVGVGQGLFRFVAVLVMCYQCLTDGEFKDVAFPLLLCAFGSYVFERRASLPRMRAFYTAILFALLVSQSVKTFVRLRVISTGAYFTSRAQAPIHDAFFSSLRADVEMDEDLREVRGVVTAARGNSIFMGPGLEYTYAPMRVPSPAGLPIYWQAGTAFDAALEPELVQRWNGRHFQTLIFKKERTMFYPQALLDLIRTEYVADAATYPNLIVYRLRQPRG